MKINDKNLCYFATSTTPVDKEGYLLKRGEINKAPQKRWFILKGNLLFYFEKRNDKEPIGVIILEGCTIELAENVEDVFSFKIMFHGPGNRCYILGAENQESMEQWMKSLACASYDYMKLMVAELQRQLDEIDDTLTSVSPQVPPRRSNPFNKTSSYDICANSQHQSLSLPHTSNTEDNHRSNTETVQPHQHHNASSSNNKNKIHFRELHTMYGRSILRDKNEFRYKLKQANNQQNLLISL